MSAKISYCCPDIFLKWKNFSAAKSIAFVFPSNYEGFGIPVIEALSCGGVVITARNSSLSEVGGEVAFYVDRESDEENIAKNVRV